MHDAVGIDQREGGVALELAEHGGEDAAEERVGETRAKSRVHSRRSVIQTSSPSWAARSAVMLARARRRSTPPSSPSAGRSCSWSAPARAATTARCRREGRRSARDRVGSTRPLPRRNARLRPQLGRRLPIPERAIGLLTETFGKGMIRDEQSCSGAFRRSRRCRPQPRRSLDDRSRPRRRCPLDPDQRRSPAALIGLGPYASPVPSEAQLEREAREIAARAKRSCRRTFPSHVVRSPAARRSSSGSKPASTTSS